MEFGKLERTVIEVILSKEVEGMEVLREQFAVASFVERDSTGVGFFTNISVPRSAPPMPNSEELREALFAGAAGRIKSDPAGSVFFMLWADDEGYLACLEGHTSRASWPQEDDVEDIQPCQMVRRDKCIRGPEKGLMPDCENTFEIWRLNTGLRTLFPLVFLGFVIALLLAALVLYLAPWII